MAPKRIQGNLTAQIVMQGATSFVMQFANAPIHIFATSYYFRSRVVIGIGPKVPEDRII